MAAISTCTQGGLSPVTADGKLSPGPPALLTHAVPVCPAPWGSATRSAQGRGAVLGGKWGAGGAGLSKEQFGLLWPPPERMGNLHN